MEDRYEYFRRTLAEEREERRRRRKRSYLIRTAAVRTYENILSNKLSFLFYVAAMIALVIELMSLGPGSSVGFLASIAFTGFLGISFILQGSLKSSSGRFPVFCGLFILLFDGLVLANWLLRK